MAILYILLILAMLLFKQQAKQLLAAVIQLLVALSNAIVNGMK